MNEIYVDVINYEGLYKVSNLGNVLSLAKGDGNGNRDRLLKQESCTRKSNTYKRVTFSNNGIVKRFQVHRLVAQHFIYNPDNKPFVNHINNDGTDNVVTNLEWCTHSENMVHAQKQGRLFEAQSKGGTAAGLLHRKKLLAEISPILVGQDFDITREKGHTYIYHSCICCDKDIKRRLDSPVFKTFRCRKCNKDKDIV